jgi:uncharacterized ferredoxin-like protein
MGAADAWVAAGIGAAAGAGGDVWNCADVAVGVCLGTEGRSYFFEKK